MRLNGSCLVSMCLILCFSRLIKCRNSKLTHFKRSLSLESTKVNSDYNAFLELLKPILIERVSDTPGNKIVRDYLSSKMEEYGWIVEQNSFVDETPYGNKNFVNVVANLPIGRNFEKNYKIENDDYSKFHLNNRIVIACHYDSKLEDYEFIGAIDSAVPCAIMLDLAKFLKENYETEQFRRISRHLQFLFFDGEEAFKEWNDKDSIYGARHHAKRLLTNFSQKSFDSIDLFVLLDLIGAQKSKFPNYFSATSNTYRLLSKIENMLLKNNMLNSKKMYYFANTQGFGYGGVQDDHLPFLARNVPVLHLIPVPFPDQWHTPNDNYENLDHNRIKDLRLILKVFLMQILHKQQDRDLKENEEL